MIISQQALVERLTKRMGLTAASFPNTNYMLCRRREIRY